MKAIQSTPANARRARSAKPGSSDVLDRKQAFGQFFTPESIGLFMAGLFEAFPAEVRLLDAGAGDGALIAAFIKKACVSSSRPTRIAVTAYEVDQSIIAGLRRRL